MADGHKSPDKSVLVSGALRLDCADERIWIDGSPTRLTGKPVALLRLLMENPQTLVPKDRIFAEIWQGRAVSDAVLTTAMRELRQAIGDDARAPCYVETVHGRGYRFLPPVTVEARDLGQRDLPDPRLRSGPLHLASPGPSPKAKPGEEPGGARSPLIWATAGAALLALLLVAIWAWRSGPGAGGPHPQSIAVLRFDDLSPGDDAAWLADGLTEEILSSLARTPDLRVASRSASDRLGRQGLDAVQAAEALGVAHIVEGSVRRGGGRLRVIAKLIRAEDGITLWTETFDAPERDLIAIQERIATRIAAALKTVMDPDQFAAMAAAGTKSVEAYEAYLRGLAFDREQLIRGDITASRRAAQAYERARALDPGFAEAHWLAARKWFGNTTRIDNAAEPEGAESERLANARARLDAAIAAGRDPIETLKYRSARAVLDLRLVDAFRAMRDYLAARPRDIDGWIEMIDLSAYVGRRDWTAQAAEAVHRLSVESGQPVSRAITASVMALRYDEAAARARAQMRLRPGHAVTQYQAHRALLAAGARAEAAALMEAIRASALPAENKLLAELRQACSEGRLADARAIAARARTDPNFGISARWQALLGAGEQAEAARLLSPLDRPERLPTLAQFLIYPEFDPRPYPQLLGRLRGQGLTPPPPVTPPFACPPRQPAR